MDTLEYGSLLKIAVSLGIVLTLVYSLSHFFKKNMPLKSGIKIIDRCILDDKRQFITIEHHHKHYTLLLSPYGDVLIDTLLLPPVPETLL